MNIKAYEMLVGMKENKMTENDNSKTFTLEVKGSETSVDGKVYAGAVVWFGSSKKDGVKSNKSFGFIEWFDNGVQQRDMFVHFSNIIAEEGVYRSLKKGQKVEFQIGTNNYGEPKAINVKVLPE
jgi:cold shock CspA family protein